MSKYCPKCNEEYGETTKFCMKCGSALQEKEVCKEEKKVMKKRKIIELSVLAAVLLAVIVGGIIFVSSYFSASAKIKRYLAAGNWDAAKEVYAEAIEGDDDAEEEVKKSLAAVVSQVKIDYTNQTIDYDTAKSTLDAVKSIAGKVEGFTDVQEYVFKLMESRKAYTSAEQLLANKEYTEAVKYYKQVWMKDANYTDAQAKIKTAKEAYKAQVLTLVNEYKAEEKYQDAVDLLQKAKKLLEDDGEIDALVIHYQKENIKKKFLAYEAAKDYAGGIAYAKVNSSVIEADPDLSAKLTAYMNSYRSDVMTRAEATFTENGYTAAVAIVDEAFKVLAGDEALKNAKIEFKNRYRADVLKRAEEAFTEQGYQAAIGVIQGGLVAIGNDEKLLEELERYKKYIPVELSSIKVIDNSTDYREKKIEDIYGNEYNGYWDLCSYGAHSTGDAHVAYVEFFTNGQYKYLIGTIFADPDIEPNFTVSFYIYADGVLVYSSQKFDRKTEAVSFDVDIQNAKIIRVESQSGDYDFWGTNPRIILTNAEVHN